MPTVEELRRRITEGKNVRATPLAEAAGMSRAAFYAAIEREEIKAISVGRTKLIPAHEAARLLGMKPEPIAA